MDNTEKLKEEIVTLEKKIEELKKMPAHSIPVKMMQDLEDLEDGLDRKKKSLISVGGGAWRLKPMI